MDEEMNIDDKFQASIKSLERTVRLSDLLLRGVESPDHKWLVELTEALKNSVTTPANMSFSFRPGARGYHSATSNSLHQLLTLLRDALLYMRYAESIEILKSIVSGCRVTMPLALEIAIHKSGLEVMYNLPDLPQPPIQNFFNQLKHVNTTINAQQLAIEQFIHTVTTKSIEEAMECMLLLPKLRTQMTNSQHGKQVATLYRAYKGLTHYLEWQKLEKSTVSSQSHHLFTNVQLSEQHAENALDEFSSVTCEAGVWDMFISNQVELLLFLRRERDALAVLKSYKDRNADNPNAYKYLLDFYHQQADDEDYRALLTEYCAKWPSDRTLCLQLLDVLAKSTTDMCSSLSVSTIFSLLDFSCYRQDLELWQRLLKIVSTAVDTSNSNIRHIAKEWSNRHWWMSFHFNSHINPSSSALHKLKNNVLELLRDIENREAVDIV